MHRYQDGLACPDCGGLAERLESESMRTDHTLGEATYVYEPTPVMVAHHGNGREVSQADKGARVVQVGVRQRIVQGNTIDQPITKPMLILTHICTACNVAFPREAAKAYKGTAPTWCYTEGGIG